MERLAKGVVAMRGPAIPFTGAEVRHDAFLWRLAAAFQALDGRRAKSRPN